MTFHRPSFSALRLVVGALVAMGAAVGLGGTVAAHTDFAGSVPADGAVVDGPLTTITVSFTNPAEPAGDGFELLDPSGLIRTPTAIDVVDESTFVLTFEPALDAGRYGVRWKVRAGDAHPIDGTFTFEVQTAATTTTTVAAAPAPGDDEPASASTETAATATIDEPVALDAFLAGSPDGATNATAVGGFGRTMTFLGTIFGVGALAALLWVVRGHREELHHLMAWVRLAGIMIVAGGVLELAAAQAAQSVGVLDLASTKSGFAAWLKVAGGLAVWFGFHGGAGQIVARPSTLSAAALTTRPAILGSAEPHGHRWSPTATATVGLVGYAAVLASYWFDGHTVSKGPWAFHSLVNFVHLAAAAIWGGGVFAMAAVVWLRRRHDEPTGIAAMVVRFSSIATVALVTVIVAGLTMAVLILDRPGDLVTTEWGRVLVAKTSAVSVVAALGGYNHFRLKPALERDPDDPALARRLRHSLLAESTVFAVVAVLTAWLVTAAT